MQCEKLFESWRSFISEGVGSIVNNLKLPKFVAEALHEVVPKGDFIFAQLYLEWLQRELNSKSDLEELNGVARKAERLIANAPSLEERKRITSDDLMILYTASDFYRFAGSDTEEEMREALFEKEGALSWIKDRGYRWRYFKLTTVYEVLERNPRAIGKFKGLDWSSALEVAKEIGFQDKYRESHGTELSNGWWAFDSNRHRLGSVPAFAWIAGAMNNCANCANDGMLHVLFHDTKPHVMISIRDGDETIHEIKGNSNSVPKREYWPVIKEYLLIEAPEHTIILESLTDYLKDEMRQEMMEMAKFIGLKTRW